LVQLSLKPPEIQPSNKLHFDNLESFCTYLEYLPDTQIANNCVTADFNSLSLKNCHIGNSILLVDRYVDCSIPSVDLEFLFESQGISNYEAFLDPEFNFKHSICTHGDSISELFSPDITGDSFNPYIRWKTCVSKGSRTCSKLMDLAGADIIDIDSGHGSVFLDIVCTFPEVVDYFVMNPDCRVRASHKKLKNGGFHKSRLDIGPVNLIDRMNRCREQFFKSLNKFIPVGLDPDVGNIFGLSSSLHLWSSSIPVLPNCHVHNLVPLFTYDKKPVYDSSVIDDICSNLSEVVVAVNNGSKKVSKSVSFGSMDCVSKVVSEVKVVEKFVVDEARYDSLRLELSVALSKSLNFKRCNWFTHSYPVDVALLREVWSDIVYSEFQDIMDNFELLDVHLEWVPYSNKSKLLHKLQYKTRPPVLDLDLFFKKCPDVVTGYDSLDFDKVIDFISYNLEVAIRCSNSPDINRYESLLKKAEKIRDNFSMEDIFNWLQFLSTWRTDTRVFGFWRNIKRYMLDPDHKFLIEQIVCPICNGSITDTGIKSRFAVVDFVVVRSRSKFFIYNAKAGG